MIFAITFLSKWLFHTHRHIIIQVLMFYRCLFSTVYLFDLIHFYICTKVQHPYIPNWFQEVSLLSQILPKNWLYFYLPDNPIFHLKSEALSLLYWFCAFRKCMIWRRLIRTLKAVRMLKNCKNDLVFWDWKGMHYQAA